MREGTGLVKVGELTFCSVLWPSWKPVGQGRTLLPQEGTASHMTKGEDKTIFLTVEDEEIAF